MKSELKMSDGGIYLTEFDRDCLTALVARMLQSGVDSEDLRELEEILTSACIVEDRGSKNRIVTVDSTVRLKDLDFNCEYVYTLVLPLQGNVKQRQPVSLDTAEAHRCV